MITGTSTADSYNKTLTPGKGYGTLIKNWQEEYVLGNEVGVSRTLTKPHVNKRHHDLFYKPCSELENVYKQSVTDNTHSRVFGGKHSSYVTENNTQFKPRSKAATRRQQGKRYELIEKNFLTLANDEVSVQNIEKDQIFSVRHMKTSYGDDYLQKSIDLNNIGRRVMTDQDGNQLSNRHRDEDLLVSQGYIERWPKATDADLKNSIIPGKYHTAQPYTFWADKAHDNGVFYASPKTNKNTFGINNTFVKGFHQYSHVKL